MNDVKLLGHIITSDLTDDKDIMHQTSMYNRKANAELSDFKHISGDLRVKIRQSYCSSFYGSPKMCHGTYVAINKLITKWYNNNIKMDDDINASIIAECIMIRDDTMTCHTVNQCDANDIVMYLTM